MKVKTHAIRLLVLLVLNFSFIISQQLPTEVINTTNGLSNNKVLHIFQDSFGLLWIGTEYGLNLYDGYSFKIFRNNPDDPESINSNVIWWIVEDKEKNLWISTGEGVSKYLRAENKFKNYDLFGDYFSSVTIYIDSKENIWSAHETENINKYNEDTDSWEKQKFILDSNITYGNPAQIIDILEDKDKKLWIASTRYGLTWYDEIDSVFRQSEIIYENGISEFTNYDNSLVDFYSDSLGILWITSRNGFHKYNPTSKKLKTLKIYTSNRLKIENWYGNIAQDTYGNIWITSNSYGLFKFDGISDHYKRVTVTGQNYSSDGISNIVMSDGYWDQSGIFWLGTFTKGLIKYDPNKKVFNQYVHNKNNKKSVSSSDIFSLIESKVHPGKIYVGTAGGGLNLLDTKKNSFSKIPIKFNNDVFGGSIRSIIEEEDGSLWLGTWGDGLLKMNSKGKVVDRYIPDSLNNNSISDDRLRVIRKDPSGNLWIGTNNGGLNYFDIRNKTFQRFNRDYISYSEEIINLIKNKINQQTDEAKIVEVGDFQKLASEFEVNKQGKYLVVAAGEGDSWDPLMWDYGWLEDDKKNIIWSAQKYESTYHIGGARKNRIAIEILQLKPGKYSIKYVSDDSHSFNSWNEPLPPDVSEFWGIRIFKIDDLNDLKNIQEILYREKNKILIYGSDIRDIHIDKNNFVWVGTYQQGLHKADLDRNEVKTYLFNNRVNNRGSRFTINDIYENERGTLWIATSRGLIEFDPIKETYKYFRDQDGLPINAIHSILPGQKNDLWLGTLNGLSNMKVDSSGKPTFVNYGIEDGLGGMDFTQLVALKSKNGKYYFGGDHGLNEFDEDKSMSKPPKLYLSDFKISNVSFSKIYEDSLVKTSLMDLENLLLNHNQNDLSFEFAALHFSDPRKNKYAHQLDGYEDEWIYDNKRIATYTNLDPGEYIFKFKGSNSEGIWNETGKSILIIINPPWWQTWWSYAIYIFGFVGIIGGIRKYEFTRRKEKEDKRILELENERKTQELEQARQLQLSMLPKEIPTFPNLEVAVYMKTATEVGGDYYDISVKDDGSVNIAIGDATGHGMKAGTLVSMMKSLFMANSILQEMDDFFTTSNTALKKANMVRMMIGFAMINIRGNRAKLMNAGMPPVYLFSNELNKIEEIKLHGTPLGAMSSTKYEYIDILLKKGDILLFMSDGFPELIDMNNIMYGYARVKSAFENIKNGSAEEIINHLKSEITNWIKEKDLNDDVTFVVIKMK